jgi:vitamin B12 transporter
LFEIFMKKPLFAQRGIASACAWLCATFSVAGHAQTNPPAVSESQLRPVVVTASRNPQQLTDTLPHTTVLSRQDIERSQAQDLPSLLQREAGVQITQSGGRGTASSLFLRGSASLQVLVLLDGVPLTKQDASGAVSIEHLALDQLERIEIVRGNVSAIYGTGAVGGVVQLFSKSGAGRPSGQVLAEAGSRDSYKLQLSAQGSFGPQGATRLAVGVSEQRTDGFSAINTLQQPSANPDKDGYRNRSASFSLAQELAKGHTIGLRLNQADGRYAFDNSFGAPADVHTGRTRVQGVTAFTDNRITADWRSQLSASQSTDKAQAKDNGAFGYDSRYDSQNRIFSWNNTLALSKDWLLTAGLEQQRQSIDADDGFGGLYARKRQVNALLTGLQGQMGAHSVQLNLRSDKVQGLGRETTGYLGYGYAFNPQWKLLASTSTAFNLAPLGYLYAPFFGNDQLKPEKARSAEIGLQWSQGGSVLRATAFQTASRNLFEYDFNTNRFENIARTKNAGLEISFSGQVGAAQVRASLTAQDPKDRSTQQTLNRRARTLAAFSWDQPVGAWQLGADLRYSDSRRDGSELLRSYFVMDWRARYAITPELSAFGRIENVADKRYQTVYGYNQSGRGAFVGLQWQPKF